MDWKLLRAVSRSFFLTIRLLPRPVREPIALGYLLARASDCIADTSGAEIERRVEALQQLRRGDIAPHALAALVERQANPAEAELVRSLPGLLEAFEASSARERLDWVWGHILRGQLFDLTRFASSSEPLNGAEIDEYTYLVAGSVGEFWTRLCAELLGDFSRRPVEALVPLGIAYGRGLQLVNMLRDRRADAAIGREYVSDALFAEAKRRARAGLESGMEWVSAVDNGRVRFACVPPARIGLEMLDRIEVDSGPVKISRQAVRRVMAGAIPALWSRGVR
ncbi:MAG: squalene/phytoene synthase family protein [Terrimicrobiaceae bacterium]|nr:squalene/phytoene synthase family protein [Terrimicrobiaceae bacterium]